MFILILHIYHFSLILFREFEQKRKEDLLKQQQEESAAIDELRAAAKEWLGSKSEQRSKMLEERKSSNREAEQLEAHVPSSNSWEEVATLVDLTVPVGEADDNNRMREVILRMKHKISVDA